MEDPAQRAGGFLELLAGDDRRELERRAGRRRFKPGASLTHEGSPGAEVLILLSGRVKISIDTEDGREVVLTFCGPGNLIGEFSVIDSGARSGTTQALEPVEALALSGRDFLALLEQRPGITMALVGDLVRRFRDADRIQIEFASAHTLGRVAARLAELSERHCEPVSDGIAITLPISQEELAGWAGASREATAKALQTLRDLGTIRTERRRIVVLDEDELRRRSA
jgi:CRP/FNR family transcriptional regulator, cyclic AMP receptor protein